MSVIRNQKRDTMSSEDIETLTDLVKELHIKIDGLLESKRATPATKTKQFVLTTSKFLDSSEPLCAYMQKNDCDGHCGKPAKFSVIKGEPLELSELKAKPAADAAKAKLRAAYNRCTACKNKGKDKSTSRCYTKIYNFLYGNNDDDDVVIEGGLDKIIGSPEKKEKKKDKEKEKEKDKKKKKEKKEDEEEPDFEAGLDDPHEKNPHLKTTERFHDKVVNVGKKFVILRCYTDKRKDVCIGTLNEEPEDEDYESLLKQPKPDVIEQMNVKYKTPEESLKETPPKAKKTERKQRVIEEEDEEVEDDEEDDDGNKAFDSLINGEDSD